MSVIVRYEVYTVNRRTFDREPASLDLVARFLSFLS